MTFAELMKRHLQDIKGWAEYQRRAEREAGIRAETIEKIASDFEDLLDKWERETMGSDAGVGEKGKEERP